jgi:hypothetical protein
MRRARAGVGKANCRERNTNPLKGNVTKVRPRLGAQDQPTRSVDKLIALKCAAHAEAFTRSGNCRELNQWKTRVKHNRIRNLFLAVLFDPRVAFYTGTGI